MSSSLHRLGIDIGSTTAKVVVLDNTNKMVFSAYQRHNAKTLQTIRQALQSAYQELGDTPMHLFVTGSAGMGLSEQYNLPFIQEVVASAEVVRQFHPDVHTLIDIGGEDAKVIFFEDSDRPPDMRMNGACAGGTGAFIDQMATLLNVSVSTLNELAQNHTHIYPIASRCGVFAKTDVQNLLAREIAREDIAASILNAVVLQTLTTLARGRKPIPNMLFCGGPLTFLAALRNAFIEALGIDETSVLQTDNAELLPAIGAALSANADHNPVTLKTLIKQLADGPLQHATGNNRLKPLFAKQTDYAQWEVARQQHKVERAQITDLADDARCFLGVDSGSTTTKVVLVDDAGRLLFDYYASNRGNPLEAVRTGLTQIKTAFATRGKESHIMRSVVTGYGEDLVQAAFGFDEGIVETLAHFRAARHFDPQVSFILDIGGQDMKAIFVEHGHIRHIEINEACSSGCGSFIQSFAESLGHTVNDFAISACGSDAPCDLGTRCTVFMNSKVKQSLREGATINDISAGLAYSVIKNALHKVLKITNTDVLGEHIIVQGGTFRNPAVHKALENLLDRPVLCPDVSELMGAYGAALTARDTYSQTKIEQPDITTGFAFERLETISDYKKKLTNCRGCENTCTITRLTFANGNRFFTGNRCERIFSNQGQKQRQGVSLPAQKLHLLFDRPTDPEASPSLTIGIPRVLNMFENFPFWNTLFVESGIAVRLSDPSSYALYKKGVRTIMSENICFPAKLVHGHIYNLIEAGVDRIFYPMVVFESQEFDDALNCYNCPIVTGYPEVIRSAIDPARQHNIPFDTPAVNLNDHRLLRKVCVKYLTDLGVAKKIAHVAFERALTAQQTYRDDVTAAATKILADARGEGRSVVMLMGRPYHIDPLINHKTPEMLVNFGVDIITEDALPLEDKQELNNKYVLTQWAYTNRYYHAARWVGQQDNVELVQLNSFGCGPDAMAVDETRSLLNEYGKSPTVIRIDEIDSTGSTRLRLRSMIESMHARDNAVKRDYYPRKTNRLFLKDDRQRTILAPQFSFFNRSALTRPLIDLGYNIEILPPADRQSVEAGLKYANNEICYPAIVLIGDVIKALQSGRYNLDNVAVGLTQTGGQCRASCYLSLLKRAMAAAGFQDVPIVSLSIGQAALHEQPGFQFNAARYIYGTMMSTMYADAISILYHATATRECHKGTALAVADKYLTLLDTGALILKKETVINTLRQAVDEFNNIETDSVVYPKVGTLGEIYVKYNSFSNNHVVQWLIDQKIEVVVPGLTEFFLSWLVNTSAAVHANIRRQRVLALISSVTMKYANSLLGEVTEVMSHFKHYTPTHQIEDVAQKAQEVLALTHRYGEGWLIAGEIGTLMEDDVRNILCLQPFGCIANHVVARGVETRIKELYPEANLLFLDADAGVSEVNYHNRLHFFVNHAKVSLR